MIQNIADNFLRFISSRWFFIGVLMIFFLQAAWAALSLVYPIAFDENYHLGIIKVYSQQLSPFIAAQPENVASLGQLPYLPSFLFHYVMSFPYRLLTVLTNNEMMMIIVLRMINIGLFLGGLIAFRRFLLELRVPKSITHGVLAMVTCIPSVLLLAAGINYDTLLFLLTPIFLLATLRLAQGIRKRSISCTWLLIFLSLGMIGCIIKYPFLPIFAGALLVLVAMLLRQKKRLSTIGSIVTSWKKVSLRVLLPVLALFIISIVLFGYRYGVNLAVYKDVDPSCDVVLSVAECSNYGPWVRDYTTMQTIQQNGTVVKPDFTYFVTTWYTGMVHRLYFAVNHLYTTFGPLPIAQWLVTIAAVVAVVLIISQRKYIHARLPYLWIFVVISVVYVASLLFVNYNAYAELGDLVAINGRYLIPLLPILLVPVGIGLSRAIIEMHTPYTSFFKAIILLGILIIGVISSGFITYMTYADSSWFWQNTPLIEFNKAVKQVFVTLFAGNSIP